MLDFRAFLALTTDANAKFGLSKLEAWFGKGLRGWGELIPKPMRSSVEWLRQN